MQTILPDETQDSTMRFDDALRIEVATLQAKYPSLEGVLSRAHAVLTDGRLCVLPCGQEATVTSQDGTARYQVTRETCSCPAHTHHPEEPCKHRYALRIYQRLAAQMREPVAPAGLPVSPETTERSAQVGALMAALARAQGHMHNPACDSTNPHFHNRYPSLAAVRDAVLPALSAEGIAVTQLPSTPQDGWVAVTTGLWHASGQYLCTTLRLPVPKADPQGYGSAITYARRYALQALVTVAGDEDDDAEYLRH